MLKTKTYAYNKQPITAINITEGSYFVNEDASDCDILIIKSNNNFRMVNTHRFAMLSDNGIDDIIKFLNSKKYYAIEAEIVRTK